mgnify:FL=1
MAKQHLLLSVVGVVLLMMLPSCLNDDDSSELLRPTALVTVCPNADGSFIMQLDDETQLVPTNLKSSPFGTKEVRALVNYTETNVSPQDKKTRNVEVNWLDSIRTKLPVETLGEQDAAKFGNDPVEIVQDWVTVAEDGYLTLRIRTLWSSPHATHVLNLVTGTNPEDPYELELRHDAKGDDNGSWGDALIAFNLNKLPGVDAGKARIKLKWKSFTGEKSAEFEIKMRPIKQEIDANNIQHSKGIE